MPRYAAVLQETPLTSPLGAADQLSAIHGQLIAGDALKAGMVVG